MIATTIGPHRVVTELGEAAGSRESARPDDREGTGAKRLSRTDK